MRHRGSGMTLAGFFVRMVRLGRDRALARLQPRAAALAHGRLSPETVRLNPPAGRLRNVEGSAARPLPPALEIRYQPPPGLSQ
jgi:hypothetical protein